jgi:hypothetical protein
MAAPYERRVNSSLARDMRALPEKATAATSDGTNLA